MGPKKKARTFTWMLYASLCGSQDLPHRPMLLLVVLVATRSTSRRLRLRLSRVFAAYLIYLQYLQYLQYLIYLCLTTAVIILLKMASTAHLTLDPAVFPGLIQHYPDYRVLYCKPCHAVVLPTALPRHLQQYHDISIAQRRLLEHYCQSLELNATGKDTQLPADQSLPLQPLPIRPGYSCRKCRFLTISKSIMRRHVNRAHQLSYLACTDNYCSVQLQTWFPSRTAKYWVVRKPAAEIATAQKHDALKQLELDKIQQLEQLEQDYTAQANALPDPEIIPGYAGTSGQPNLPACPWMLLQIALYSLRRPWTATIF